MTPDQIRNAELERDRLLRINGAPAGAGGRSPGPAQVDVRLGAERDELLGLVALCRKLHGDCPVEGPETCSIAVWLRDHQSYKR